MYALVQARMGSGGPLVYRTAKVACLALRPAGAGGLALSQGFSHAAPDPADKGGSPKRRERPPAEPKPPEQGGEGGRDDHS